MGSPRAAPDRAAGGAGPVGPIRGDRRLRRGFNAGARCLRPRPELEPGLRHHRRRQQLRHGLGRDDRREHRQVLPRLHLQLLGLIRRWILYAPVPAFSRQPRLGRYLPQPDGRRSLPRLLRSSRQRALLRVPNGSRPYLRDRQ